MLKDFAIGLLKTFAMAVFLAVCIGGMAVAERRPALVEAIESQRDCSVQIARLDAERFEAEKRVARLRGALTHLKYAMQRDNKRGWRDTDVMENPVFGDYYKLVVSTLQDQPLPKVAEIAR